MNKLIVRIRKLLIEERKWKFLKRRKGNEDLNLGFLDEIRRYKWLEFSKRRKHLNEDCYLKEDF